MKRISLLFVMLLLVSLPFVNVLAQNDLLRGIFEKEAPVFTVTIEPTDTKGSVEVTYHFTHSKASALEVSVWIKDLGTSFRSNEDKKLVAELQQAGNRQKVKVLVEELRDLHFYTIGVDYRNPSGLVRKFNSVVLKEGYRYESPQESPQENPLEAVEEPRKMVNKSVRKNKQETAQPCLDPDFSIQVDPNGYCADANRPAVLIQCNNCQGTEWSFSVEARTEYGEWQSLRADGKRQEALGVAVRTEPLCLLKPGIYRMRVLAWGTNCDQPVIKRVGTTIMISDKGETVDLSYRDEQEKADIYIPEACGISGEAFLKGNRISGTIALDAGSACIDLQPFVRVRYIHPGHRDLSLDDIPLLPGSSIPFEFELDDRDLRRGIQTIQVVEYVKPSNLREDLEVRSFWVKAQSLAEETAEENSLSDDIFADNEDDGKDDNRDDEISERGVYEPSIDEQSLETVNVTASDPNCNQIQEMQLVYGSGKADLPLYISWLSPRCCQEEGCDYTVWAGESHEKLRLLIKGSKPSAIVKELLQNIKSSDGYFEVVVKTPNGNRKAAYVMGEGPKYGSEEILAYHDRLNPPESDPLIFEEEPLFSYAKPELSVDDFRSCRIFRETSITKEEPLERGEEVTVKYHFAEKGYRYTLYQLPEGASEWFVAPGTEELADKAEFTFTVGPEHSGKYIVLAYNPSITWGCLSKPISEPLEIKVLEGDE